MSASRTARFKGITAGQRDRRVMAGYGLRSRTTDPKVTSIASNTDSYPAGANRVRFTPPSPPSPPSRLPRSLHRLLTGVRNSDSLWAVGHFMVKVVFGVIDGIYAVGDRLRRPFQRRTSVHGTG